MHQSQTLTDCTLSPKLEAVTAGNGTLTHRQVQSAARSTQRNRQA